MRSFPAFVAIVLGSLIVGALPAGAADSGPPSSATKAKDACALLTSEQITEIFTDAPLDPGPTSAKLPKHGNKNFSQCLWDDLQTTGPVPQLIAKTSLARGINKAQAKLLTTPQANANARSISGKDLNGLGSKGVIEINPEGSYATVGALKGKDYYIVSVGYVGAQPFAPITDIEIMTLAREASKRV
jgi:hypothetical protein